MEMPAVFAYPRYDEPVSNSFAPLEKAEGSDVRKQFDWFFASGVVLFAGLLVGFLAAAG